MKKTLFKRAAMLVAALTICVVGMSVQNTSYAASLAKPKGAIVAVSENKITMEWNKVKGATKYQIYRATSKKGSYKLVKTTTKTTWADTKAKSENYWYKVRAVKGSKKSAFTTPQNTFYAETKCLGYTKIGEYRVYKIQVKNCSKTKNMYLIPEIYEDSGMAGAIGYNIKTGDTSDETLDGQLCTASGEAKTDVQTISKKSTAYVYVRVKDSECQTYPGSKYRLAIYSIFTSSKEFDNLYILMTDAANNATFVIRAV
jgi:hypothetical protein